MEELTKILNELNSIKIVEDSLAGKLAYFIDKIFFLIPGLAVDSNVKKIYLIDVNLAKKLIHRYYRLRNKNQRMNCLFEAKKEIIRVIEGLLYRLNN